VDTSESEIALDMILDDQDNILIVGERVPAEPTSSVVTEGMIIRVTPEGENTTFWIWDEYEVNRLTEIALDSMDNIVVSGVGGYQEETKTGFVAKLSPEGEQIWTHEIQNIVYNDYIGIEVDLESDDIFFAGTLDNETQQVFVTKLTSSGHTVWNQTCSWIEQDFSTAHGLILTQQGLLVIADHREENPENFPTPADYIFAYDVNGTQLWKRSSTVDTIHELNDGNLLGAADDSVQLSDQNMNTLWETTVELHCTYRAIISDFVSNESENIIACGYVWGLFEQVRKSFTPALTLAFIPQTLIVSMSTDGEVQWYDFIVVDDQSRPCAAQFDSAGRLVVVGTSGSPVLSELSEQSNLWIITDFVPAPFPIISPCQMDSLFYTISVIPIAAVMIWAFNRARTKRISSDRVLRLTVDLFRRGGFFFAVFFFLLGGLVMFPKPLQRCLYGLVISVLFVAASYGIEWLANGENSGQRLKLRP
jgi:hypothetical protein